MKIGKMDLNSNISDRVAFITIMVAGALMAWFTIHLGEKIIANSPNSEIFNIDKRIQKE